MGKVLISAACCRSVLCLVKHQNNIEFASDFIIEWACHKNEAVTVCGDFHIYEIVTRDVTVDIRM